MVSRTLWSMVTEVILPAQSVAKIELSDHLKEQLRERDLDEALVRDVLANPSEVVDGYHGRKVAHRLFEDADGRRLMRVVYAVEGDTLIVITAYMTVRVSKYWRGT